MQRLVRMTVAATLALATVVSLGPASVVSGGRAAASVRSAATRARPAGATAGATAPTPGALYTDGPDGRYLLGGGWLFRLDQADVGTSSGFMSDPSLSGWSPTSVPNAWNATDESVASVNGTVAWYRRDFLLPDTSSALDWIVRFESVNFRAQVWLNGRLIGSHVGAYLPFEFELTHLNRRGVNRLVIRVDNRRSTSPGEPRSPQPPSGWWNYGGLLGEVYVRKVDRLDFQQVIVRPTLPCTSCDARIQEFATVHNYSSVPQIAHVKGTYGSMSLDLGTQTIDAGQSVEFGASSTLSHPRLWSPAHPTLYRARLTASALTPGAGGTTGGRSQLAPKSTRVAGYTVLSGVRSIRVTSGGRLLLNGQPVHFRGVAVHEDDPFLGAAIDSADRAQIIAETTDLGATLIRAHYPLQPELEELADRYGILLWSEIPIYQLSEQQLGMRSFTSYGRAQLQANIAANQNHPSVAVWSIGNELRTIPGAPQVAYIASQVKLAKQLDPTRPVGLAVAADPLAGCQAAAYAPLDVLGMNDYFGWYVGSAGAIADRDLLSGYLDSMHSCYPHKALAVTEFGAEANRAGPVEERGTYAFQSDFATFHLAVYATKPWLAGATYFTLREFRVGPAWSGGNPWPQAPIHQKGLISFAGVPKPAYSVVRQIYRGTRQYG